jgi:hypothetical protein
MDIRVVDKDGDWYVNNGSFPIVDYGRGTTEMIALQPGIMTQLKASQFLQDQPTVSKVESPFGEKTDGGLGEETNEGLAEKRAKK